jgi:hypothetical protein
LYSKIVSFALVVTKESIKISISKLKSVGTIISIDSVVQQPTSEDWEINLPQASERPLAEIGRVFQSVPSSVGKDLVGLFFFLLPEKKNKKEQNQNLQRL